MERVYKKPTMVVEQFVSDEYVAACGDENKVYKFTCDAGARKHGNVYLETNGKPGLQKSIFSGDKELGGYEACGATHEASTKDDFLPGYYCPTIGELFPVEIGKVVDVIVWRGPKNDDTHCTENLDMTTWETDKS